MRRAEASATREPCTPTPVRPPSRIPPAATGLSRQHSAARAFRAGITRIRKRVVRAHGDESGSETGASRDKRRHRAGAVAAPAPGRNRASGFGGGGAPGPRITTAPVVAAAPGALAEKQSSRERTDAGERTYDNAAGPRNSPRAGRTPGWAELRRCLTGKSLQGVGGLLG